MYNIENRTQFMIWDHILLRKFSSTGHFRLLSQVKTELRTQPLVRKSSNGRLSIQSKPLRMASSRQNKRPNILDNSVPVSQELDSNESAQKSFRDRLDDIDMR